MPHTMINCTCEQCNNSFQVTLGRFHKSPCKFCSRACHYQHTRDQAEARFWSQVDKNGPVPRHRIDLGPCWLWTGQCAETNLPYGRFFAGKQHMAHRYAWEIANGPIPIGLQACHKCDNPPCVNPDHIFLGTALDNRDDMRAKGRGLAGRKLIDGRSRGEKNPRAKLTAVQVAEIRASYKGDGRKTKVGGLRGRASTPTLKQLAAQYGVAFSVIHSIVSGQIWQDVE